MASGLYQNTIIVERSQAAYSAAAIAQKFMSPCDLDVIGLAILIGTAPGANAAVTCQVSNSPTSQLSKVAAFNLWTTANIPTISGTNTSNLTAVLTDTVVDNVPYALNYPFPGPAGTVGYETAQQQSTIT